MPSGEKTVIQFPYPCPTCQQLSLIYGGRYNVSEGITLRYRNCLTCQKQFVTNIQSDGSEVFRHWVRTGERHPHKGNGQLRLWGSKRECLKMLLRAAYYETYCRVRLGDDEGVTEETRELIKLCKTNVE